MIVVQILSPGCALLPVTLTARLVTDLNAQAGRPIIELRRMTLDGQPVVTEFETEIAPSHTGWAGGGDLDLVALHPGPLPLNHLTMGVRGFLMRAAAAGATLAEFSSQPAILAHLDMLSPHLKARTRPWPAHSGFVRDGNRILSDDNIAAARAVHDWFAERGLSALAARAAKSISLATDEMSVADQYVADTKDPILQRMQALMAAHLDHPLPVTDIAEGLDISGKQMRNRCRNATGDTPAHLYLKLRLKHANQLIETTELSVAEIAARSGFASASAFTRSYRAQYGQSPRTQRAQRRLA